MEAILKSAPGKGQLTLGKVAELERGPFDVVIRVERAAICGTDFHIFAWDAWSAGRIKPPLVMGHEFCGSVESVGREVTSVKPGDFVSAECHIVCGTCYQCRTGQGHICANTVIFGVDRQGAFAERITVPEGNVWKVNPNIPKEHAAIFDPLGNAVHTVMAAPVAARTVVITGCGPIGLFAVSLASHLGARVIASDVNADRLSIAKELGASVLVNPAKGDALVEVCRRETGGLGADTVLEMSGSPVALKQGLEALRMGGEMRLLGIPAGEVPINLAELVIFKGLTMSGIIGRKMYETWYQVQHFLLHGMLNPAPVITHRLPFGDFQKGFDAIAAGQAGKVILSFN
ncbi:MAG: L-threonine 3-dehydrogenase [Planctomycetota bacterium]